METHWLIGVRSSSEDMNNYPSSNMNNRKKPTNWNSDQPNVSQL